MKKQFSVLPKIAALSVLAAFAAPVMAQQAGDNIANIGWFHLKLQDSSETLRINGNPVPGSGAGVKDTDTLGIQFTHFFTDNIALSTDLGIPPEFKLNGEGTLSGVGQIGTAKQWSPAVVAKYYFGDANSQFRPYLGAGVTYVWYSNIKLNDSFQQSLSGIISHGTSGALKTNADLSSSWAPIANAGIVYNFDKNWSANFSLSYVPLKTKADLTTQTPVGPVHSTTKLTLNPIVSFVSVGYRF